MKECARCKKSFKEYKETKEINSFGAIMIRGECPNCLAWIKWVPHYESIIMGEEESNAI